MTSLTPVQERWLERTSNLILEKGIPVFVKRWRKRHSREGLLLQGPFETDEHFIEALNQLVRDYHRHSSVNMYDPVAARKITMRAPECTMSRDNIGTIRFFTCLARLSTHRAQLDRQVRGVKAFLAKHRPDMRGLIMDFRGHHGGDIYPLYALEDLFGDAVKFAWSNTPESVRNGTGWDSYVSYTPGRFTTSTMSFTGPIALLIGGGTGSAGEAGAAMFWGKPNVRSFGVDSGGFMSGNTVSTIGDGAELTLTEVLVTTSDGTFHPDETLHPDVVTTAPLRKARKWILSRVRALVRS